MKDRAGERIDQGVLQRAQRPADHDDRQPRDRGLELKRGLQFVCEVLDDVGQLGPRHQRMRHRHGRRSNVEQNGLTGSNERRRGPANRELLLGEPGGGLFERALEARREPRDGAAADPVDLTALGEELEVAAHGHAGDAEALAELGDADEFALLDQREHLAAPPGGGECASLLRHSETLRNENHDRDR